MPKVTIYTQVYNAGEYLKPCLDSVVGQTDPDWQLILVDSCSTDGSPALIDGYAERDPRIVPIHMPENRFDRKTGFIQQYAAGKYITTLDHDDWWEPDYIERLCRFAEEEDLDYAMTGVEQYFQETGKAKVMRRVAGPLTFTLEGFADHYPLLGPFAGAQWGNLIRLDRYLDVALHPEKQRNFEEGLIWRSDTLYMLDHIENSRRIGIDDSVLYHYRMHGGSQITCFNDSYFKSNLVFYEKLQSFLERNSVLDMEKQEYLKKRHLFEMGTTLANLKRAELPMGEKLRRYAEIAGHPLTAYALTCCCKAREDWWTWILSDFAMGHQEGQLRDPCAAKGLFGSLVPRCESMLSEGGMKLLLMEHETLLPAFADDDPKALAKGLLRLMEEGRYEKKAGLEAMFRGLLPAGTPFRCIRDDRFFKKYAGIAAQVLDEDHHQALEQMTGELLKGRTLYAEEDFLQLYLTLAAIEGEVSAFLFGKVCLAKLFARQHRLEECRAVLAELEEMGAGDVEGAAGLREGLETWGRDAAVKE